jgi:hypothetical protein
VGDLLVQVFALQDAEAMARVTILFSIGTSSGTLAIAITRSTICALNSRIRSSPRER